MGNYIRKIASLFVCTAAGFLTACISVTYEGMEDLPPLKSGARVGVFYEKNQIPVPESQWTKVGEVTASASTASFTMTQIKSRIIQEARDKGANGVLILSVDSLKTGEVRSDQVKNLSAPTWTTVDDSATNIAQSRDMLIYSSGSDPDLPTYTITIKALLFKLPESALKKASDDMKKQESASPKKDAGK